MYNHFVKGNYVQSFTKFHTVMYFETNPLVLSLLTDYGHQVHHYWLFIILGVLALNSIPIVIAFSGFITNEHRSETCKYVEINPAIYPHFSLLLTMFYCLILLSIIWIWLYIFMICAKVQQLKARTPVWSITKSSVTIQILQWLFSPWITLAFLDKTLICLIKELNWKVI